MERVAGGGTGFFRGRLEIPARNSVHRVEGYKFRMTTMQRTAPGAAIGERAGAWRGSGAAMVLCDDENQGREAPGLIPFELEALQAENRAAGAEHGTARNSARKIRRAAAPGDQQWVWVSVRLR